MTKTNTERQQNAYAGSCVDCRAWVEPMTGRLYRYSGANCNGALRIKHPRRGQGQRYTFAVRCELCYVTHDKVSR
jgi:hypothetical protein